MRFCDGVHEDADNFAIRYDMCEKYEISEYLYMRAPFRSPEDNMFPKPEFYGSATVGERGQVVLPASARKRMGLAKGDKLLVVGGPGPLMGVMLVKVDVLDDVLQMLTTEMANWAEMAKGAKRKANGKKIVTATKGKSKK
jgi:AbrB family looped-hinge helix DNA binding protein